MFVGLSSLIMGSESIGTGCSSLQSFRLYETFSVKIFSLWNKQFMSLMCFVCVLLWFILLFFFTFFTLLVAFFVGQLVHLCDKNQGLKSFCFVLIVLIILYAIIFCGHIERDAHLDLRGIACTSLDWLLLKRLLWGFNNAKLNWSLSKVFLLLKTWSS